MNQVAFSKLWGLRSRRNEALIEEPRCGLIVLPSGIPARKDLGRKVCQLWSTCNCKVGLYLKPSPDSYFMIFMRSYSTPHKNGPRHLILFWYSKWAYPFLPHMIIFALLPRHGVCSAFPQIDFGAWVGGWMDRWTGELTLWKRPYEYFYNQAGRLDRR